MPHKFITIVVFMISFVIIGNYGIHLFFKIKRQKVFADLKDIEYDYFENLKTYIEGKSRISYSWRVMSSDVIMYENNIIIIPYIKRFKRGLKQYQPILQYSFDSDSKKLDGITSHNNSSQMKIDDGRVFLNSTLTDKVLNAKTELELDFSEQKVDLKRLSEKNSYVVQQA